MGEIDTLEAIPVEVGLTPFEAGGIAPYVSEHDAIDSRQRMLLRVETRDGVVGWGELLVTMKSVAATKAVIDDVVAPRLIGRETDDIRGFIDEFYFPYVSIDAFLGGVEMALWDLKGKELGTGVSELLGGPAAADIPVAYCLGILDPEESAQYAERAVEAGYETLKTKAGRDWEQDIERVIAMDEATDGNLQFRLDPNQGWSTIETIKVTTALEKRGVDLEYLEQPQRVNTFENYRNLRNRVETPVAVNEDMYRRFNLYHLVKADAIDAAVVDIVPGAGILRTRELAAIATHAGIPLSHHNGFDLGIKQAAVLHTIAATPAIELPPDCVYYGWDDHIIDPPLQLDNGVMSLPTGSGLGIDVDEDQVARLRLD